MNAVFEAEDGDGEAAVDVLHNDRVTARLRDYALRVDAEYFVGRADALAEADKLLAPESEARVLLVHGPGGIGKSALLREIMRRAVGMGYTVFPFDGRSLVSTAGFAMGLDTGDSAQPLIVIDEAESLGASIVALREALLDGVSDRARVILASRLQLDRAWLGGVLEGVTAELALGPLDEAESRALLARRAVVHPDSQDGILRWTAGSPLALTVGAASRSGAETPEVADLADQLIQHLAGTEIDGVDPEVLLVASLTWAVDARLIAAALPDRSTRHAMPELLALSVTERIGHRVVLHPLLAEAIRARLRLDNPLLARTLTQRIADHLATRALDGDASAMHELTNLIDDPAVRGAVGLGASATHYAEAVQADAVPPGEIAETEWWANLRPWVRAFPRFATRVRRVDGGLAGFAAYIPGAVLPEWASADPALGPVVAYLAARGIDPVSALIGVAPHAYDGRPAELSEIVRVANTMLVTRSGMANPRFQIAPFWAGDAAPTAFLTSMGYRVVPELARIVDGAPVDTWVADLGPDGLVGHVASLVAAQNGTAPARRDEQEAGWLMAALREFHDDDAMAARGPIGVERSIAAKAARSQLLAAVDAAFGDSPSDRRLRRVLELGYLTPGLNEMAILGRLHLSRATYYRRLREARQRLAG